MPSTSQAQARLMAASAHTSGGFGGVPQDVGKDFNSADTGKDLGKLPKTRKSKISVDGSESLAKKKPIYAKLYKGSK